MNYTVHRVSRVEMKITSNRRIAEMDVLSKERAAPSFPKTTLSCSIVPFSTRPSINSQDGDISPNFIGISGWKSCGHVAFKSGRTRKVQSPVHVCLM